MSERLEIGKTYYIVTPFGDISSRIENGTSDDDWYFEWGNYFHNPEQAFNLQQELIGILMYN